MDYQVTHHDNPQAYKDVSSDWKFTLRRNESGTWIFPPLAGVSYLIDQFIIDRPVISQELYGSDEALVLINCTLSEALHEKDSLERELYNAILEQLSFDPPKAITDLGKLMLWLGARRVKLGLLVYGLDAALRAGNMEAVYMLNRLAMNNRFVSVILLLGTDATDPQFWPLFSKCAALIQNISVIPRKSVDEGKSFFRSLEEVWGVKLTDDQRRWVEDNLDHSLRFTKEVFRQAQKNPNLTYDELYSLPSLEYKVQALLDNLLEDQREVVLRVVDGSPLTAEYNHAVEYLETIRWIRKHEGKYTLAVPYIAYYIRTHDNKNAVEQTSALTPRETIAFELLESHRGNVVTRDELADAVWGSDSAEKYSDWAIDQLIHRLKSKITQHDRTNMIRTVRGRGFMLDRKS